MVKKNSLFILFLTVGFLFADPPNWEIIPTDYEFNGSVTSAVYLNDELVGGENDILAGFVGDEVRGLINGLLFPPTGTYSFNLMLFSDLSSGETEPNSDGVTGPQLDSLTLYRSDETVSLATILAISGSDAVKI